MKQIGEKQNPGLRQLGLQWKEEKPDLANGLRYWALGRAWILFGSRKNPKPRLREMLENAARRKAAVPSVRRTLCWAV